MPHGVLTTACTLCVATLPQVFTHDVIHGASDVKAAGDKLRSPSCPAPTMLRPIIAKLLSPTPKARPTFADILGSDYFRHPLVVSFA